MKKTSLVCLFALGCGVEAQVQVKSAEEVPPGHEAVTIGVCRRVGSEPQLIPGRGRFYLYECEQGRLIFDPVKDEVI